MNRAVGWFRKHRNRAYVYRGLVASAPVAVVYGVVNGEQAAVLLGFAGAWLGVGLATSHSTTDANQAADLDSQWGS